MSPESATGSPLDGWLMTMLKVSDDASCEESRRAFLQQVEDDGFASDESTLLAVARLSGTVPSKLSEQRVVEWQLRNDVEEFSRSFFDMSPGERQEKYDGLLKQATEYPNLKRRLQRLERGLKINRDLLSSADQREVRNGNRLHRLPAVQKDSPFVEDLKKSVLIDLRQKMNFIKEENAAARREQHRIQFGGTGHALSKDFHEWNCEFICQHGYQSRLPQTRRSSQDQIIELLS